MRLLKESVLQIWKARKESVAADLAHAERQAKAIQEKLDRLDEAFLFERSIDIDIYDRHAEKLRQELTLLAHRPTLRSSMNSTWKASWRSQSAFCRAPQTCGCRPHSNSASGSNSCSFRRESRSTDPRFVGTAVTAPAFSYLRPIEGGNERLVDQTGIEPVTS